mgnify:CR=1 FL=1
MKRDRFLTSPALLEYKSVHNWIKVRMKKNKRCEHCFREGFTHYSNKTGKYLRDVRDWQELCPKCHYKYDVEVLGLPPMLERGKNANHKGQQGGFAKLTLEERKAVSRKGVEARRTKKL